MARSKDTWASWTIKFQAPISYMHFWRIISTTACPLNGLSLIVQHPLPLRPNISSIWACVCRQQHPALRCQAGRTVSGWYMYAHIYIYTYTCKYIVNTWILNDSSTNIQSFPCHTKIQAVKLMWCFILDMFFWAALPPSQPFQFRKIIREFEITGYIWIWNPWVNPGHECMDRCFIYMWFDFLKSLAKSRSRMHG